MENVCCENAKTETYILATVTPQMYKVRGKKNSLPGWHLGGFFKFIKQHIVFSIKYRKRQTRSLKHKNIIESQHFQRCMKNIQRLLYYLFLLSA